ncbi:hypothetical protein [Aneurinibacillus terranovensis]|uniref:hypothetical protein n=1 Tax=Aneurinibacillus terranovensis TaxID=278991 RepID=UPI001FE1B399|nr:hypothetical protein [Aneurinibacillus terranovensis]
MGTPVVFDPVHEQDQVVGHSGKGSDFFDFRCDHAGHHVLLVNVQPAHVRINDVHTAELLAAVKIKGWCSNRQAIILSCVLPKGATICDTPGRWGSV